MTQGIHVAKAADPHHVQWRQRIEAAELPVIAAFLAWVEALHGQIDVAAVAHAVATGASTAFDHIVQAVTFAPPLAAPAQAEAVRDYARLTRNLDRLDATLKLSLNLRDPNFTRAVDEQQARLVREVSDETRRAVANIVSRAYTNGMHPYDVAPQIREAVGLTSRQAQAVLNFSQAQTKAGVAPETVSARSVRYAERMRTRRAKMIGRTETARAQVAGRMYSYEQAAGAGLFNPATAMLEWSSMQEDPSEVCFQLDGQQVDYTDGGDGFEYGLPPIHPACRCEVHLVLE